MHVSEKSKLVFILFTYFLLEGIIILYIWHKKFWLLLLLKQTEINRLRCSWPPLRQNVFPTWKWDSFLRRATADHLLLPECILLHWCENGSVLYNSLNIFLAKFSTFLFKGACQFFEYNVLSFYEIWAVVITLLAEDDDQPIDWMYC